MQVCSQEVNAIDTFFAFCVFFVNGGVCVYWFAFFLKGFFCNLRHKKCASVHLHSCISLFSNKCIFVPNIQEPTEEMPMKMRSWVKTFLKAVATHLDIEMCFFKKIIHLVSNVLDPKPYQ